MMSKYEIVIVRNKKSCNTGAAATCMETPFRKGSVFEAGSVRMIWVGFSKLGINWTTRRDGRRLGSKVPDWKVNSLQQRRAE